MPESLEHSERLDSKVWDAEKLYVRQRRDAAGLAEDKATAGLALSGGGIRSASFNLGFVQALMRHGKFRDFDYLSTVSGGGYLGGFLAAQLARSQREKGEDLLAAVLPEKGSSKQPLAVRRLLRSGRYLKRVVQFLNRYLYGLVVLNLWIFFGLAALGALAAWLFRFLDRRDAIHFANAIGFPGDIPRAFLPAAVCFVLWMIVWAFRSAKHVFGRIESTPIFDVVTRALVVATLVFAALGVVAVLVTSDTTWSAVKPAAPELDSAFNSLAVLLAILQLLALVPALRLDKLVQSGARPRNFFDSLVFNLIAPAIVFGLPLLSFGWFAREDVSGIIKDVRRDLYLNEPDAQDPALLCFAHVREWDKFWTLVRQRAEAGLTFEQKLVNAANQADRDGLKDEEPLDASIRTAQAYRGQMAELPLFLGFYHAPTVLALCKERDQRQRQVINEVNSSCIDDSRLLTGLSKENLLLSAFPNEMADLVERAKGFPERPRVNEVRSINRQALQAYFGNELLSPPGTVFALTTWSADQAYRLTCFGCFALLWIGLGLVLSPNAASLQEFYRDRLKYMWLPRKEARQVGGNRMVLSELQQSEERSHTFPFLIINATAHMFRGHIGTFLGGERDQLPQQTRFEFTPICCGYSSSEASGKEPKPHFECTRKYEQQFHLDLAGIMAISGSAVSPAMTENFMLKTLLFLSNIRLGQWVRQPNKTPRVFAYPRILACLGQVLLPRHNNPSFVFLSDGGHYDNLGIEALLDRRVREIVCVDAGQDAEGRFLDLLKVVRRSRFLDGVEICSVQAPELASGEIEKVKGSLTSAHFFKASIRYPGGTEGRLYYVKPSFNRDEPAELLSYRDENPDFPHDPTLDQFYDERRFESYRALGWHIGESFLRETRFDWLESPPRTTTTIRKLPPTPSADAPAEQRDAWVMALRDRVGELSETEVREILNSTYFDVDAAQQSEWDDNFRECIFALLDRAVELSHETLNRIVPNPQLRELAIDCSKSNVKSPERETAAPLPR